MSIKRNTVYNIGGALVPLALTLFTVPLYLRAIGEERYGVLALVWLLLGYFGLFDLGLSHATSNAVARSRVTDPRASSGIFLTSLATNAMLGIVTGLLVLFVTPLVLAQSSGMSPALRAEILDALPWLAASVPAVTVGGVFYGVLNAHERFGTTNAASLLGNILFALVPLYVASRYSPALGVIIPAAVIARAMPILIVGIAAIAQLPLRGAAFDRRVLRTLLAYGGWIMVSNLLAPILISVDQFAIGAMLGAAAVAQYSIAYSLAVRLQILPTALMQTMFPRLSQLTGAEARALAGQALRSIAFVTTTLCVPAILLARPFLTWWIDADFARASAPVAEILLVSIWFSGLAIVPSSLLQAQARPDLVAKFHLLEVAPFLAMLYVGILLFGLQGAALAWLLRIVLDTALLFGASKLSGGRVALLLPSLGIIVAALALARGEVLNGIGLFAVAVLAGLALFALTLKYDPLLRGVAEALARRVRRA